MGCGYSKDSAPSHYNRNRESLPISSIPAPAPSLQATEYILPCANPWITPISRAIIAIPRCSAGDLQVQIEPTEKRLGTEPHLNSRVEPNDPEFQVVHVAQDSLAEVRKRVTHRQLRQPEGSTSRSTSLRFRSVDAADEDQLDRPVENAEWDVTREDATDTITNPSAGALMTFEPDQLEQYDSSPVAKGSPTEEKQTVENPVIHDQSDTTTVVESQTFVGRDQNGAAHLFNVHTIRHPTCAHDPLQGEVHIQIMHKTPIHQQCVPANVPVMTSAMAPTSVVPTNTMPTDDTNLPQETSLHSDEGRNSPMYITMGRANKSRSRSCRSRSCVSGATTDMPDNDAEQVHSEVRGCCQLRCAKQAESQRLTGSDVSKSDPDENTRVKQPLIRYKRFRSVNPNSSTPPNLAPLPSPDELVDEPLIQAVMHVPAVKCSHSRVGDCLDSSRKNDEAKLPMDYTQQVTNSSAHSDSLHLPDYHTALRQPDPRVVLLQSKSTNTSDYRDASCQGSVDSQFCSAELNTTPESDRYLITMTDNGRRFENRTKITPRFLQFFATEVTDSAPNETIEEWNAQVPVQYVNTSSTDMTTTQARLRETKKSLKRAILDRIAGLRNHDVVLQSSLSTGSEQNPTGVTACFVEETKFHKCDQPDLPKFELAKHFEQWQQHLPIPKNKQPSNSSTISKVDQTVDPAVNSAPLQPRPAVQESSINDDFELHRLEESDMIQPLCTAQLMDEHSILAVEAPVDQQDPDKSSMQKYLTKPSLSLSTRGLSTSSIGKPTPDKTLPLSSKQAGISSRRSNSHTEAIQPPGRPRPPREWSARKQPTIVPSFLPPIRSAGTVTTASITTSTTVRTTTENCRDMKEVRREDGKPNAPLPKLKSVRSNSSYHSTTSNMHNTDRGRTHLMSGQRKPPYDILVVHPQKRNDTQN